jgi:hypothetical protein
MIAAATGSLLGGRLAVIGGRGARLGKGWEADFARFGVGAFGMVRPDWMRANAALILPISVAARTGAVIRASPAFGVFDVSSVVIGGNFTRLSKL